jgi:hypothetical protein
MSEVKKCPKCGGEMEKGDKLVGKVVFFQFALQRRVMPLVTKLFPSTAKTAATSNCTKRKRGIRSNLS